MAAIKKRQKQYKQDKADLDTMIANLKGKIDDLEDQIARAAQNASSSSGSSSSNNNYVPPVGTGGGGAIVSAA